MLLFSSLFSLQFNYWDINHIIALIPFVFYIESTDRTILTYIISVWSFSTNRKYSTFESIASTHKLKTQWNNKKLKHQTCICKRSDVYGNFWLSMPVRMTRIFFTSISQMNKKKISTSNAIQFSKHIHFHSPIDWD